MHDITFFRKIIEEELQKLIFRDQPGDLYDPIRYMLQLGGKRIRPSLTLMSCEVFGGDFTKAISPALGIEVFHNFTLLHDDIMDKAPLRRSQPTVHTKWNADVAILSGDAMFVKACQLMMNCDEIISRQVMHHFLESALLVCEGQQWDMTFQEKDNVTIEQYLRMIEMKTAVLLACSLKTGALIANAKQDDTEQIYRFGKNLGVAFQLHDDLLDVFGEEEKFGKQSGGDILANKKTFLLLKARELSSSVQQQELNRWITAKEYDPIEKVVAVKTVFHDLGIKAIAEKEMDRFYNDALESIEHLLLQEDAKNSLRKFATRLMRREN